MRARQQPRQITIALIRDNDRRSGFSHEKIRACDSGVRRFEVMPENGTGLGHQRRTVVQFSTGRKSFMLAAEARFDVFTSEMEGRRHDVARALIAKLDDVLAEVRLNRVYS